MGKRRKEERGGREKYIFSSRRRHTRCLGDWSSDVCSSDLLRPGLPELAPGLPERLDRALVLRTEHSFCLQRLVVRTVLRGPNAAKSYPNLIPNPFLRQKKSPKNGMASRGLGKV